MAVGEAAGRGRSAAVAVGGAAVVAGGEALVEGGAVVVAGGAALVGGGAVVVEADGVFDDKRYCCSCWLRRDVPRTKQCVLCGRFASPCIRRSAREFGPGFDWESMNGFARP